MQYKALVSFTGLVSMACGDVREISDVSIAKDLLKAGYVVEVGTEVKNAEEKPKAKTKSPKRKENNDGN